MKSFVAVVVIVAWLIAHIFVAKWDCEKRGGVLIVGSCISKDVILK